MNLAGDPSVASTGSPYADLTGITLHEVANGLCEARLKSCREVTNTIGIFHGGALFTLADVAMGAAGWSLVYPEKITVTKSANIDFLRPGRAAELLCRGEVIKQEGRHIHTAATIEADDEIIAKASGILVAIESPLKKD